LKFVNTKKKVNEMMNKMVFDDSKYTSEV